MGVESGRDSGMSYIMSSDHPALCIQKHQNSDGAGFFSHNESPTVHLRSEENLQEVFHTWKVWSVFLGHILLPVTVDDDG